LLTDFFLYIHSSSFVISPDSTLTQLHTFLTLFYSFLLILVDGCPTPKGVLPTESQNICMHCQKCCIFITWENSGHLVSQTEFCGTPGQSSFKP